MSSRLARVVVVVAACLTGLGACSSAPKFGDLSDPPTAAPGGLSDLWSSKKSEATDEAGGTGMNQPWAPKNADGSNWINGKTADTTGSVTVTPAEPGPSGEPIAPGAKPSLLGDDPHDDLQLAKKYFRTNAFGLAEKAFRTAVEKHPRDAEAWLGLAASYDRLHRFDLADRAYQEAIRIVGATVEILNNQGFSYMLRGDYARARKKLDEAAARDPANPYVAANLRLLQESYREGKAIQ